MKKSTKLLALFLAVVLTASLFALPASAQSSTKASGSTNYPVVLVHGLLGWGSYDELNKIIPYFGMGTGSVTDYLKLDGYKCYAASVGPLSSAWDRACQLYAQLT